MRMGGLMKVHSSRRRQYGLMLILAFGAAILGVMAIHKLRERRILSLLVKERDRDIFSLQLLLQKERDDSKEAKKQNEEMRVKIYSFRTQKMELDSRILELQSTISSLRDEQRTIASALEEKQNEIKLLREKEVETNIDNPQVVALTETLKQKEAEIQDLKSRLQVPIKVLSVITDDLSNPDANLTKTETWSKEHEEHEAGVVKEETKDERSKGSGESLNESTTYQDGDSSKSAEYRGEDGRGLSDTNETTGEHSQNSSDKAQGEKIKDLQEGGMKEDKTNAEQTETIANQGDPLRTKDEKNSDHEARDDKGDGQSGNGDVENVNSQGDKSQELEMNARGGVKLEMPDNSQGSAGYGVSGKHGNRHNSKGKRWKTIAINRRRGIGMNARIDEEVSIRKTRFQKDAAESKTYNRLRDGELQKLDRRRGNHESDQENEKMEVDGIHQQGESMEVKNEDGVRLEGGEGKESGKDVERAVVSADANSLKSENSNDAENESEKGRNTDINQQIEKGQEVDIPGKNIEKPNGTAGDADKKKSDEVQQSGENGSVVQQQIETGDGDKADQNSEEAEELEVVETQAAETDFRESRAEVEEDKEESLEDTDEPEF